MPNFSRMDMRCDTSSCSERFGSRGGRCGRANVRGRRPMSEAAGNRVGRKSESSGVLVAGHSKHAAPD